MKHETRIRRRLAGEMRKVRVAMPKPEIAFTETWPKAKLRKRKPPHEMSDNEIDELLALPDPPDSYDDDYDGAY